jgi:hypothetical protein
MIEMPSAREAMSIARMVWDFDGGTRTVPEKVCGVIMACIEVG